MFFGIAWDGQHFWASDKMNSFLYKINSELSIVDKFFVFQDGHYDAPIFSPYLTTRSSTSLWMTNSGSFYYFDIPN